MSARPADLTRTVDLGRTWWNSAKPLERIRLVEELASRAWPALRVEPLSGWRLRFNHGVTRRTNSVWPNDLEGDLDLDGRLDRVRAFYARHALPARFHISPAALPVDLDLRLAERGFALEEPTWVETAPAARVIERTRSACAVDLEADPSAAWAGLAWPDDAQAPEVRRATVERIGAPRVCATARLDGEPAGAALGVAEGDFAGVFAFHTRSPLRRRGVAGSLLGALARWALERGASSLYLQVEEKNAPARALWARSGFEPLYRYHYRTRAA